MELTCLDIIMNLYEKNYGKDEAKKETKKPAYHELTCLDIILKISEDLERKETPSTKKNGDHSANVMSGAVPRTSKAY